MHRDQLTELYWKWTTYAVCHVLCYFEDMIWAKTSQLATSFPFNFTNIQSSVLLYMSWSCANPKESGRFSICHFSQGVLSSFPWPFEHIKHVIKRDKWRRGASPVKGTLTNFAKTTLTTIFAHLLPVIPNQKLGKVLSQSCTRGRSWPEKQSSLSLTRAWMHSKQ